MDEAIELKETNAHANVQVDDVEKPEISAFTGSNLAVHVSHPAVVLLARETHFGCEPVGADAAVQESHPAWSGRIRDQNPAQ